MRSFEEEYGPLTDKQVSDLQAVARVYYASKREIPELIEKVAGIPATSGNVQYVLDILSGRALEKGVTND